MALERGLPKGRPNLQSADVIAAAIAWHRTPTTAQVLLQARPLAAHTVSANHLRLLWAANYARSSLASKAERKREREREPVRDGQLNVGRLNTNVDPKSKSAPSSTLKLQSLIEYWGIKEVIKAGMKVRFSFILVPSWQPRNNSILDLVSQFSFLALFIFHRSTRSSLLFGKLAWLVSFHLVSFDLACLQCDHSI